MWLIMLIVYAELETKNAPEGAFFLCILACIHRTISRGYDCHLYARDRGLIQPDQHHELLQLLRQSSE